MGITENYENGMKSKVIIIEYLLKHRVSPLFVKICKQIQFCLVWLSLLVRLAYNR